MVQRGLLPASDCGGVTASAGGGRALASDGRTASERGEAPASDCGRMEEKGTAVRRPVGMPSPMNADTREYGPTAVALSSIRPQSEAATPPQSEAGASPRSEAGAPTAVP